MTSRLPIVKANNGLLEQLQTGDNLSAPIATTGAIGLVKPDGTTITIDGAGTITSVGGGGGGPSNANAFGSVVDAMAGIIDDSVNSLYVGGFNSPGDGGAGYYSRTNSPKSPFIGQGFPDVIGSVPPTFAAGIPNNAYSSTIFNFNSFQPILSPIPAGCLAIVTAIIQVGGPSFPSTFGDSSGNTYHLAVQTAPLFGLPAYALYYSNTQFEVPVGGYLDVSWVNPPYGYGIAIYTMPGFVGGTAVLDQTNQQVTNGGINFGGASISTSSAVTANPSFCVGFCGVGQIPYSSGGIFEYTPPAGWFNLAVENYGRNPTSCTVVNSNSVVTYHPTWDPSAGPPTAMMIATFKVFGRTSLDPSYWQLNPSWPVHTAQYGITPSQPNLLTNTLIDNTVPLQNFGRWLASIAPPSSISLGGGNTPASYCTISSANPAVVTVTAAAPFNGMSPNPHLLQQGMIISFDDDGLPTPIVKGQRYFIQYGTVTPNTFEFSTAGIYGGAGTNVILKGTPFDTSSNVTVQNGSISSITWSSSVVTVVTSAPHGRPTGAVVPIAIIGTSNGLYNGYQVCKIVNATTFTYVINSNPGAATGGTWALAHTFTTYAQDWAEVVFDTGIYYCAGTQFINGYGLRKLRVSSYGVRFNYPIFFAASPADYNSIAPVNTAYSTLFNSTNDNSGQLQNSITLSDPTKYINYYPNSWVWLGCNELQGSNPNPFNSHTFEFKQISQVANTGVITFYEPIRYNYRSTFPPFEQGTTPSTLYGVPIIVQLPDIWDQELHIIGNSMYATSEQNVTSIKSVILEDIDVYGFGFHTGPFPSFIQKYICRTCRFHDANTEIDKSIDYLEFDNCTFDSLGSIPSFQSGSINFCVIKGSTIQAGIQGTPKNLFFLNSIISSQVQIGPAFGITERIVCIGSHINYLTSAYQFGQAYYTTETGMSLTNGTLTIAPGSTNHNGGTWHNPSAHVVSDNPVTWGVPGAKGILMANATVTGSGLGPGRGSVSPTAPFANIVTAFNVLDTYVDGSGNYCVDLDLQVIPSTTVNVTGYIDNGSGGSGNKLTVMSITPSDAILLSFAGVSGSGAPANTIITTDIGAPNLTAGLGVYTLNNSALIGSSGSPVTFKIDCVNADHQIGLSWLNHPCAKFTAINCTGGQIVTDMNGCPPDTPIFSYFNRSFSGFAFSTFLPQSIVRLVGNLEYWNINVVRPYTGAASSYVMNIYMYGWKQSAPAANASLTWSGGVVTVTTSAAHGLLIGSTFQVIIAGAATPSGYNGIYTATVTGTSTFTYPHAGTLTTPAGTPGTWVMRYNLYPTLVKQTIDLTMKGNPAVNNGYRTMSQGAAVGTIGGDSMVAVPFWLAGGHLVEVVAGSGGGSDTLANMPKVVMTAQADQGIDADTDINNTTTSGLDLIAGSVIGSTL